MKILTTQGEEVASVSMTVAEGGSLSAAIKAGDISIAAPPVEISIEGTPDGLIAHVRIPGIAKTDLLIEPQDVKQMMKIPMKGLVSFGAKTIFSGK
ncbi:MAG: hypothetical protein FWF91_04735 [Coriobacteriia bacterium]|nr:hypothetical protein [Coriobacteriia bacterium]